MKILTPAKLSILMFCLVGLLIAAYIGKRLLFVTTETPAVATRNVPMPLVDLEPGMTVTASDVGLGPVRVD
ncbi:MAG: Flp pilus assembly protein CpaB, partial [Planctomycetaceae bacterium]